MREHAIQRYVEAFAGEKRTFPHTQSFECEGTCNTCARRNQRRLLYQNAAKAHLHDEMEDRRKEPLENKKSEWSNFFGSFRTTTFLLSSFVEFFPILGDPRVANA